MSSSSWIDPDVSFSVRNDRVCVSFPVSRSVRTVSDVLLHVSATGVVCGVRGERAKIRGTLLHTIVPDQISTNLSNGRFEFAFFSKSAWPTLLDADAAPINHSRFLKFVVVVTVAMETAASSAGSEDALTLATALGDVLGVLQVVADVPSALEYKCEQIFRDADVGLVPARLVRDCTPAEADAVARFANVPTPRLTEWVVVNSDKKLWVVLSQATLYLFNRDLHQITAAMLRACDPRAQRKLDAGCTVKPNDKHPKVVEVAFGNGKKITLKFVSSQIAADWRAQLDLCIRKLAWHERFVPDIVAETKARAADKRTRAPSAPESAAAFVARSQSPPPAHPADDDDEPPPPPPPSISPLARANSITKQQQQQQQPPAQLQSKSSSSSVSPDKLDRLRGILLDKVRQCHQALLQRRATMDEIANDEAARLAIVTHLAAPVKRFAEVIETPRTHTLVAVRERLRDRSKLEQLIEHVLALFDYQLVSFQTLINEAKSADVLREQVKLASFVLEHAGRVLQDTSNPTAAAAAAVVISSSSGAVAAAATAAAAESARPPLKLVSSEAPARLRTASPLGDPIKAPPEPAEDDAPRGSPKPGLQRALSSAGANNDLATAYRVRKMALVGRIGLIQQRVKTGDADDDDIMQLATLQTELSDLDAKIASEDARVPRGAGSVPLRRLQISLDGGDSKNNSASNSPLPSPRISSPVLVSAPSGMISPRKAMMSDRSVAALKAECAELEERLKSLEASADTGDDTTLRTLDALRSRVEETRAALQRAIATRGDPSASNSTHNSREVRELIRAASSAAAEAEAAAVVNAAFADVIKSPIGSPIASPAASPRGSPTSSPLLSRRKNKGSGGAAVVVAPLPVRGSSEDRLKDGKQAKRELKESDKELERMQQMIEAVQKLAEAERADLATIKALRKQEEEAIADLKQKRKTEAARLRSLEEKARLQELALKQMQASANTGTLTHTGSPASQSPAHVRRAVLKTRQALDKLPTGQSMLASVIDESLAPSPRSGSSGGGGGSPRVASKSSGGAIAATSTSAASSKSKREAEAAALRSKLDELQLRRGVLMGTITDVERSLGNKKKDVTTLNMLAELTVQLGDIDDRTVVIGNEIAQLMQDPEQELRELLERVQDDKKMLRALARIMVNALPKESAAGQAAQALPAETEEHSQNDDVEDDLTIVAIGTMAVAGANDDNDEASDSVEPLPDDLPVPPVPGDADADAKEAEPDETKQRKKSKKKEKKAEDSARASPVTTATEGAGDDDKNEQQE
jgi:hypothetical protein